MTTQPCEICMEDKLLSQHTYCPNGHLGGCQKCHMNLVKSLYETSTTGKVFADTTTAQQCMFCRQHMWDRLMGENWSLKLTKVQPILCYNMMKRLYGREVGFDRRDMVEIVEKYNDFAAPEIEDYKFIEGAFLIHKGDINDLCKTIGDEDGWNLCKSAVELTKEEEEEGEEEEDEEELEVVSIIMNGKTYYLDEKTRQLYNPETSEEEGFLPLGGEIERVCVGGID